MRSIYLKTGPLAAAFPYQTRRGRVSFAGELILCWRIDSNGSRKSSRGRNGKDGGGHGRINKYVLDYDMLVWLGTWKVKLLGILSL